MALLSADTAAERRVWLRATSVSSVLRPPPLWTDQPTNQPTKVWMSWLVEWGAVTLYSLSLRITNPLPYLVVAHPREGECLFLHHHHTVLQH